MYSDNSCYVLLKLKVTFFFQFLVIFYHTFIYSWKKFVIIEDMTY